MSKSRFSGALKIFVARENLVRGAALVATLLGLACGRPALTSAAGQGSTPVQSGTDSGTDDARAEMAAMGLPTKGWPPSACPNIAQANHAAFRLSQVRNLASPLPDPTGVTSDGNALWILAGGHNSFSNTLVRFNPETGATERTFSFDNLIEQGGTGAYGIAWDGEVIWISVSGNTNKLVRVDPTNGQLTRIMSSPTVLGPSDVDFDGSALWLSSGTGDVFQIDRTTGGIQRRFFTSPASSGRDNGVASRPGQLWVGELFGGLEVLDPATGAVLATARHEDGSAFMQDEMGSSTFVGCQIVIASRFGITYYEIHAAP
jgi:hypothetical protein